MFRYSLSSQWLRSPLCQYSCVAQPIARIHPNEENPHEHRHRSPRRDLEHRRRPTPRRLHRPPPDGVQGPRHVPATSAAPSSSPTIRWPRPSRRRSRWRRSTPATTGATTTCAPTTSSTSRHYPTMTFTSTEHHRLGRRLRAHRRPDDQGRHAGRSRSSSSSAASAADPWGNTKAGFTADRRRSTARTGASSTTPSSRAVACSSARRSPSSSTSRRRSPHRCGLGHGRAGYRAPMSDPQLPDPVQPQPLIPDPVEPGPDLPPPDQPQPLPARLPTRRHPLRSTRPSRRCSA